MANAIVVRLRDLRQLYGAHVVGRVDTFITFRERSAFQRTLGWKLRWFAALPGGESRLSSMTLTDELITASDPDRALANRSYCTEKQPQENLH
jgi:hypothetical protein